MRMKRIVKLIKILVIIILSIILLMVISVGVAKIYEDDLASYAIQELENEFQAPMSIGEVSLIPLFSFPNISAEINKLYIGNPNSTKGDTLFFINSLKLGLNSWDLMHGVQTVDKLEVSDLDFEYIVDSSGTSNLDFLIDKFGGTKSDSIDDSSSSSFNFSAEKVILKDIQIYYYDSLNQMGSSLKIPEINIKAKSKNDLYEGKTDGSFILTHSFYKDTKLDQMKNCKVDFDLKYEDNQAQINQLSISSEGIDFGMKGKLRNSNGIGVDAEFELSEFDLNILKKYFPDEYLSEMEQIEFAKLEPVHLDLIADYKDEKIDIQNLSFVSDGIEIGVKGSIKNADTIDINTEIQAVKLDFAVLKNYIPSNFLEEYGIKDIGGDIEISGKIKGQYADSVLLPKIDAQAQLQQISLKTKDYPSIDTLNVLASVQTAGKTDFSGVSVHFSNGVIRSSDSKIKFDGKVDGIDEPRYFIHSDLDLNLDDFAALIPDSMATKANGNISASFETKGIFSQKMTDAYIEDVLDNSTLSMNLKNVSALIGDTLSLDGFSTHFTYQPVKPGEREVQIDHLNLNSDELNIHLKNASLSANVKGELSNPKQIALQLDAFNIQNGNLKASGRGSVKNLEKPDFDISTKVDLQLQELNPFLPDSLVKSLTGFASAKINSRGRLNLDSLDTQLMKIVFKNSDFDLAFINAGIAFADSTMDINNITASVSLKDDVLKVPHFVGKYNGVSLEMDSTIIKNIYSAFLQNRKEELYVQTHIKVGDVFLNDFKNLMALREPTIAESQEEPTSETVSDETQNWTFLMQGSASINSIKIDSMPLDDFTINKLDVQDMSMLFKLSDSSYIVDQFKFKAFEGEMNNSFHYKLRDDGTQSVSSHNIVNGMNLRTLLHDMNNFGQDSLISYENISGLLSTDLNMFIPIEDSVRIDKMMVSGDLTLEKGGVYDYAPAQEISKFTGIKELDNIQFKTLHSNIFMFKNRLYVPRTEIVSNAIDIAAFGMESLDGDSEYHMEIHLSNILFGKSKKRNKKQKANGDEIDKESLKKSSRKIRYTVEDGRSKVTLDSKDSRDKMMNKIRTQNKMLDFIFFPKNIHYDTHLE